MEPKIGKLIAAAVGAALAATMATQTASARADFGAERDSVNLVIGYQPYHWSAVVNNGRPVFQKAGIEPNHQFDQNIEVITTNFRAGKLDAAAIEDPPFGKVAVRCSAGRAGGCTWPPKPDWPPFATDEDPPFGKVAVRCSAGRAGGCWPPPPPPDWPPFATEAPGVYPWPVDPKGPDDSDLRAANADQADVASKDMLSLFRSWPAERGQLRNFIVTERGQGLLGDATAILGFSKGRPAAAATIPVGKITALPDGWRALGYIRVPHNWRKW